MGTYSEVPPDVAGLSNEQLLELFNQPDNDFQSLSNDDLRVAYDAIPAEYEPAAPVVNTPPPELSIGQMLAGGSRELAGGALFEFADEAEAAARAPFSAEDYDTILKGIRQNRAQFSEAYPATAMGLNVAGGVGSMFVPGANVLGRTAQGLTGISKITSPVTRVAASSALAGGVSGIGSGEDFTGRVQNAMTGAGLGLGLGTGGYGAAKAGRWLGDVFTAKGAEMRPEDYADYAAQMLSRKAAEGGLDAGGIRDLATLSEEYGVPFSIGTASPELARMTEMAANTPSGAREDLVRGLVERQAGAGERVEQRIRSSIPTPDYFASQENIIQTLRNNAKAAYGAVNDVEIRDPVIMDILNAPDIKGAYADALKNVEREKVAAKLRGEDPAQYDLRKVFEPILDAEGSLVGLGDVPTTIPDIKTLNQIKIALDRRIDGLYRSGDGGDATTLKTLRNAFVDRLDQVGPPEYLAARRQYKGDIEIKEALETGRNANKMRWQEVNRFIKDRSPGEVQAFKTGYVQRLMQGFEDTSRNRNFAKEIVDNASQRKKLQAIMEPGEFQVFEAAMRVEADNFNRISRITGGSQTAGRLADRAAFEQQLAGGNVDDAVSMLLNPSPGNIAQRALRMAGNMRKANVSRGAYTQLARMLKAGTPDEIEETLRALEAAAPAQQAADRALERGATKTGASAAMVVARSPEIDRELLPEVEEVVIPDIDEELTPDGLSVMPSPVGAEGGDTGLEAALSSILPGYRGILSGDLFRDDGAVVQAPAIAEALGIPLAAWRAYAGGN